MPVISLRAVVKRFGRLEVVRDASFDIQAGHTYGLVGPNGSGKSVLLRIICGLSVPTSGSVTVDPAYLSANRSFPDRFGVTINGPAYVPSLTGRRNLIDLAAIRNRIKPSVIDETLYRVGLDPALPQKVRNYSLGMKQKLSLAQALMENPEVLILDEPFNALDTDSAASLTQLLRDEHQKGTTILFTSHHRADIDELSEQVLRFEDGVVANSAA